MDSEKFPKTLVIGASGFLGRHFFNAYRRRDSDVLGLSHRAVESAYYLDLASPHLDHLQVTWKEYRYAIICAAIPNILRCHTDPEYTFRCNVTGTLSIARQLIERGITPILFSSDYVFDGKKGNYDEEASPSPLNEYGRQKAELERRLFETCRDQYLLVRLSKVFALEYGGATLLDEMATKLKQGMRIRAAHDQIFRPMLIQDLVSGVISLQAQECRGVYNFAGPEIWSRLDLARALARALLIEEGLIEPISLDDLNEPFIRPKSTDLCCDKLSSAISLKLTPPSVCIEEVAKIYK